MIDQTNTVAVDGMITVLWRECRKCGEHKPETRENWRFRLSGRYAGKMDGRVCRECGRARQRAHNREYRATPEGRERKQESDRQYNQVRNSNPEYRVAQRNREQDWRHQNPDRHAMNRKAQKLRKRLLEPWYSEKQRGKVLNKLNARFMKFAAGLKASVRKSPEYKSLVKERDRQRRLVPAERQRAAYAPHVVYLRMWPDVTQYVGVALSRRIDERWGEHKRSNKNTALRDKCREQKPVSIILHFCKSRAEALELEKYEIARHRAAGITLLNKT